MPFALEDLDSNFVSMFGEDCILGEAYGGRRQLSRNGSHNMQKSFATA